MHRSLLNRGLLGVMLAGLVFPACCLQAQSTSLRVEVQPNGAYSIGVPGSTQDVLTANVAAKINGRWVYAPDYPRHTATHSSTHGYLGAADEWEVTYSGLAGEPNLVYRLRAYRNAPFADLKVIVDNTTGKAIQVQSIREVEASKNSIANLGAAPSSDRVLSDSFSEDRPAMQIHNLGDAANHMDRAVGSQLIYNRQSRESLFLGALTSQRFLTVLRLHTSTIGGAPTISHYEVDSTGTTELEKENSLQNSPAKDQIELSLPVAPGQSLASETLLLGASKDYHNQLETYGSLIKRIHHARVSAPPLMGWWSWTAYYFGLDQGTALTNAEWESEHLKQYGYNIFHIDEGYQYARGEYITPNATLFPAGLTPMEYEVRGLGLVPGIWTAPFEVSVRSWVYQKHPDWLIKNAQGQPIPAGNVVDGKDQLYMLDTTNPGAQAYLHKTYSTLVHTWDIHYIKLDFMDDSAIEGYYYRPHTTAMEAQRIGLQIIRGAVGNHVYLDKDGSVMLNPVGLVDYGRISQDTGHTFGSSRDAATGIAARYYMDRNFFVSDPDAFTVSTQVIKDQDWHGGQKGLTKNAAQVSISLAAVSGGMLEIGDNLPSLEDEPQRQALIENRDLIDMVKLGKASVPLDLMSYAPSDQQPSIFYLKESKRQSILTVFNWTEHPTKHSIRLADLGLAANGQYEITNIFDHKSAVEPSPGMLQVDLAKHSVSVLKIVNQTIPASAPDVTLHCPASGATGATLSLSAQTTSSDPALSFAWSLGDGVQQQGAQIRHAWTEPGDYQVHLTATSLDDVSAEKSCTVHVSGRISTVFDPAKIKRYKP
ncbi:alpha-galactosidase [Acidobacterium capsulatum]|uniref:alpha-galactosidase n=1 Tax=Acidobacterium capsulatum TaxID=33075 RepID=UPI0002F27A9C|nr:alpha-galactosidase [Acidobacterium capsulatum]HCT60098.1 PKD domain-containing protein [Acidobacterium sp.]